MAELPFLVEHGGIIAPLVVVVPPQQSALWLGAMALYYLPEQSLAAVRTEGEPVGLAQAHDDWAYDQMDRYI